MPKVKFAIFFFQDLEFPNHAKSHESSRSDHGLGVPFSSHRRQQRQEPRRYHGETKHPLDPHDLSNPSAGKLSQDVAQEEATDDHGLRVLVPDKLSLL